MEPVPTATASPGANDPRYWCTAPGSATDFGLGACNWSSLSPSFASNTNPPVITDYSNLMRLIVPPACSSTNPCPTGMSCSSSGGGVGYCVPQGCSSVQSCPSGYTCSNSAGGVCYVACTADSDCAAQGTASACGIEAIPNSTRLSRPVDKRRRAVGGRRMKSVWRAPVRMARRLIAPPTAIFSSAPEPTRPIATIVTPLGFPLAVVVPTRISLRPPTSLPARGIPAWRQTTSATTAMRRGLAPPSPGWFGSRAIVQPPTVFPMTTRPAVFIATASAATEWRIRSLFVRHLDA